jgi:hypothetical protein
MGAAKEKLRLLGPNDRFHIRGEGDARFEITVRGMFPFVAGLSFEQVWFQPGDALIVLGAHPEEKNTFRVLLELRQPFSTMVP